MTEPIELLREALNLLWEEHDGDYGYISPKGKYYRAPEGFFKISLEEVTVTNL